jgi:hypothetical protein
LIAAGRSDASAANVKRVAERRKHGRGPLVQHCDERRMFRQIRERFIVETSKTMTE